MSRRYRSDDGSCRRVGERAQLSMPLVEAGIGVVLILGLAGMLALGTPAPQASDPQLDAYAADVGTVLSEEPARHDGTTRIDEVSRSPEQFEREADALERRVDDLLPDNLLFRLEVQFDGSAGGTAGSGDGNDGADSGRAAETRTAGFDRPAGAVTGSATVTTSHGRVRIEVWYP